MKNKKNDENQMLFMPIGIMIVVCRNAKKRFDKPLKSGLSKIKF